MSNCRTTPAEAQTRATAAYLGRCLSGRAVVVIRSIRLIALLFRVAAFGLICASSVARAQDMEPRAYSVSPIDTNFLLGSYFRSTGGDDLDPSLPIKNLKGVINGGLVAYDRTFDLFGQQASGAIALPYFDGNYSGDVFDTAKVATRKGLGDLLMRITENLIGGPALTPAEFAQREPTTTVGVSFTAVAPTGDYNPQHLLNIGSDRWSFRPEVGFSQPIRNWFIDGAAGVWLHTDNPNFLDGHVRGQDPLWTSQAHVGYNFRPGLWLALDATHYFGGDTILDGVNNHDFQSVSRYGVTLSLPIANGVSAKVAWAGWLSAHNGGQFNSLIVTLQYRWFDR